MSDRDAEGLADVLSGVSEDRVTYDAVRVGQCRALLEQYLCNPPFIFVPSVPDVLDLCLAPVGNQQSGEPCRYDLECATGHFCSMLNYACPGTCQPYVQEGEFCDVGSEYACQPVMEIGLVDLLTDPTFTEARIRELDDQSLSCDNNRCQRPKPLGQSCVSGETCAGDGYCDSASGVCKAPIAQGGSCEIGPADCAEGLWCDQPSAPELGVCRPLSSTGMPCDFESDCVDDLRCVPSSDRNRCSAAGGEGQPCDNADDCQAGLGCQASVCAALPTAGATCALGDICAPGFVCILSNTCVVASAHGEPCNDTDLICTGFCNNGLCEARREAGQSCMSGDECTTRTCENGVCVDEELCEFRRGS
jgi:hypothetical protein